MAQKGESRDPAKVTPFGGAIRRRIKELQADDPLFTQERVARLTGISRQHLWRALRGLTKLSVFEVGQLARVLRLDPDIVTAAYTTDQDHAGDWNIDDAYDFITDVLPEPGKARTEHEPFEGLSLSELRELRTRAEAMVRAKHMHDTPMVREKMEGFAFEATPYGYEMRLLPRELRIPAQEFRLEAMRAGADDRELIFIDSVLASPEAVFRHSGYRHDQPLSAEEQRAELDSVIAMLRAWLKAHIKRRSEPKG